MIINTHSVAGRIAIGKFIGLAIGLIAILVLPYAGIPAISMFSFGMVIMFMLMGAMIGFIGQFETHPLFGFKMKWWLRGPTVGFAFFLMFALLTHEEISMMMESPLVAWTGFTSPWWVLLDGIFYGGLIGWIQTKVSGEGSDLPLS